MGGGTSGAAGAFSVDTVVVLVCAAIVYAVIGEVIVQKDGRAEVIGEVIVQKDGRAEGGCN